MKMRTNKLTRRGLLAGLGAVATTLPFLRFAPSATAAEVPKRLLVFFTPNGPLHPSYWRPGDGFAMPDIFTELTPYAQRLLLVDNLLMGPSVDDPKQGHNCMGMMLTGAPLHYPNPDQTWVFTAQGPSVDHHIAHSIGVEPLVVGAAVDRTGGTYTMCYAAAQTPVAPIIDPVRAFERAFGSGVDAEDPEALARIEKRKSVLDIAARHLGDLAPRMPKDDRVKLERHLDEVRALEKRLSGGALSCDPVEPAVGYDFEANESYPLVIRDQIDIATQALKCNATQVAAIQIGSSGGGGTPKGWPGLAITSSASEHEIIHAWRDGETGSELEDFLAIEKFYAANFRALLDALGPELDNTLVVWARSIGYNHSHENVPFMLVGGEADGSYRAGRHIDAAGRNHNELLASICRIMGLEVDGFGAAPYATGVMDLS